VKMGARKIADFKVKGITTMNAMVRWMIASFGILVFGFAKGEAKIVNINGTNYYNRAAMTHSKVNEMRMYDATIPVKLCNEKATGQAPGYPMRGSAKNCCEHITRATFEKLSSGEMEIRITVALPGLKKVDDTTVYWDHNLISEKGKYSEHVRVWIDWNGDKKWSPSECVLTDSQKDYKALSNCKTLNFKKRVSIPANAVPETYARVILSWGDDISDPTAKSWMWGDVTDSVVHSGVYQPPEIVSMISLGTDRWPGYSKIAISGNNDNYIGVIVKMAKSDYDLNQWSIFVTGASYKDMGCKELSCEKIDKDYVKVIYELKGRYPQLVRKEQVLTVFVYNKNNLNYIYKELKVPVFFDHNGKSRDQDGILKPNWYICWRDDGACPSLQSKIINYDPSLSGYGVTRENWYWEIDEESGYLNIKNISFLGIELSDEVGGKFPENNFGGVYFPEKKGVDLCEMSAQHELMHRELHNNWMAGGKWSVGKKDSDRRGRKLNAFLQGCFWIVPWEESKKALLFCDWLPDDIEDTFVHDLSATTVNSRGLTSSYKYYGDEEFYIRVKTWGIKGNHDCDWSSEGMRVIREFPSILINNNASVKEKTSKSGRVVNAPVFSEGRSVVWVQTNVVSYCEGSVLDGYTNLSFKLGLITDREFVGVVKGYLTDSVGRYICWSAKQQSLCNGTNTVVVSFPSDLIYESQSEGPYVLSDLEINSLSDGASTIECTYTNMCLRTKAYGYKNFKPSLMSICAKNAIVSKDGLEFISEICSNTNGIVNVTARLVGCNSSNIVSYASTTNVVTKGITQCKVLFPLDEIWNSRINAPYVIDQINMSLNGEIQFYAENYKVDKNIGIEDFEPNVKKISIDMTSFRDEMEGFTKEGKYKALKIGVDITNPSPSPDLYEVKAMLYSEKGQLVSCVNQSVQLSMQTNKIDLYWSGASIANARIDGRYCLKELSVYDLSDGRMICRFFPDYKTSFYLSNQFVDVPFAVASSNLTSQVSLKNGKCKSLDVLIPIKITTEGEITIDATLVDADGNFVASASLTEYRNAGDAIFTLPFQGGDIFASGKNGPYRVVNLSVSHSSEPDYTYDEEKTSMITEAYKHDDFVSHSEMYGGIPTEGLVYQLDASNISSITTNANGEVLEWFSTDGLIRFATDENSDIRPCYIDDAIGGRGAILFGSNTVSKAVGSSRMATTTDTDNQTVFIVTKPISSQNSYAGVWGSDGFSMGFSAGSTSWFTYSFPSTGALYKNGIRAKENPPLDIGQPQILTAVSGSIQDFTTAIGNFFNSTNYPSRYYKGEIGEIIVYNRELTDAERLHVELHLQKKWITGKDGLFVSTPDRFLMSNAQNAEMEIVALSDWKVTNDSNWLTLSKAEGTNIASVAYSVDENLTGTNRVARIIVSNTETSICHTVTQYFQDFYKKGIEFENPVTISHDSDVRTDGELIAAYCVSYPRSVNGVYFSSSRGTTFSGVSWYGGTYSASAAPWSSLSANYKYILTGAFGGSKVTLNGLEIGRHYLVQLWSNNSTENGVGDTMIVDGGRGSRTLVQNSTGAVGGVGQYVVGYFVADASHIDIALSGDDVINAIQLRKIEAFWRFPNFFGAGGTPPSRAQFTHWRHEKKVTSPE